MANRGNRNQLCRHFVKLAMQGRKGSQNGGGSLLGRTGVFGVERDESHEPSNAAYQGFTLFVNSLSEEGGFSNQVAFEFRLAWTVVHEIGHLFILVRGVAPFDGGEHFYGDNVMASPKDTWSICVTSSVDDSGKSTCLDSESLFLEGG